MTEFKQNQWISILQSAHKEGNPLISLSCAELKTHIPLHSKSIGCPKIFPLSAPVLCTGYEFNMHLESESENERKTLIYTQLKISRYNQHFFAILDEFLETELRAIYCRLITVYNDCN